MNGLNRIARTLFLLLALFLLLGLPVAAAPGRDEAATPRPVSPAGLPQRPAIVAPCPTLSWSGVDGAREYGIEISERGDGVERVLFDAEVGDSRSWTPTRCLETGRDYVWRVRADGPGSTGEWSRSEWFRVAESGSLEAALERAVRRLVEEERLTVEELDWLRQLGLLESTSASVPAPALASPSAPASTSGEAALGPGSLAYHTSGDAVFHVEDESTGVGVVALGVDYGIYAEAFVPGAAVAGRATAPTGINAGVYGWNKNAIDGGAPAGTMSIGVLGTGKAVGVKGTSIAPLGRGVRGRANSSFGLNQGVVGESASSTGKGVEGVAIATGSTNYGVRAVAGTGGDDFYAGGAGMDYGPFTGAHLVRLPKGLASIRPGMVVAMTGEVEGLETEGGSLHLSSTLPTVRLAVNERDPAALGAFVGEVSLDPEHPWWREGSRIGAVNALGEGRLWVADVNGVVEAGDYLCSSAVAGYAQRQGELELGSHTVAKAIETIDWSRAETLTVGGQTVRVALIAVVYTGG